MTEIMNTLLQHAIPRDLAQDEYMDDASGFVYCKKCHTPRQVSIVMFDAPFKPYCLCKCQSDAKKR